VAKVSGSLGGEERLSNRDLDELMSEGRENLGSMAGMLSKLADLDDLSLEDLIDHLYLSQLLDQPCWPSCYHVDRKWYCILCFVQDRCCDLHQCCVYCDRVQLMCYHNYHGQSQLEDQPCCSSLMNEDQHWLSV